MYSIDDIDRSILEAIYEQKNLTANDILTLCFAGDPSRLWHLYRRLQKLEEGGFIQASRLEELKGAASPKCFSLKAKGARAAGRDSLPSSHYKKTRKDFYDYKSAKLNLEALAERHGWKVFKENDVTRSVIAQYFAYRAKREGRDVAPEYIYLEGIPLKIEPDIVLTTKREALVVSFAHPSAKADAFKKVVERYRSMIYHVRFILICAYSEQARLFSGALSDYDNRHKTMYSEQFLILAPDQLNLIEGWVKN